MTAWHFRAKLLVPCGLMITAGLLPQVAFAQDFVPKQLVVVEFASCIVRRSPDRAAKVLDMPTNDPKAERAFFVLLNSLDTCLVRYDSMRMGVFDIKSAIAEQLIITDTKRSSALATMPVKPPVRAARATDADQLMANFSGCLAQADPAKTVAVLQTAHLSPAENAAVIAYGSSLADCIPVDVKLALNIPRLRNHLALVAYDLSRLSNATARQ